MTAAVAPPPHVNDSSALARKRRREIMSTQRGSVVPESTSSTPDVVSSIVAEPPRSKRKVSEEFLQTESLVAKPKKGTTKSKKPQMKYDPDVPMTKEEAAVWRREQRRKRNRESAAASRQRQRDRIVELEVELEDWKQKFNDVMEKLGELEQGAEVSSQLLTSSSLPAVVVEKTIVSPSSTPSASPRASPTVSPVVSCSLVDTGRFQAVEGPHHHQVSLEESEKQHLINMISLPAVKITGEASAPLLPEDSMFAGSTRPDTCQSTEMKLPEIKLAPVSVVSARTGGSHESVPCLLTDEEEESEFGEFLLDAVQWL